MRWGTAEQEAIAETKSWFADLAAHSDRTETRYDTVHHFIPFWRTK